MDSPDVEKKLKIVLVLLLVLLIVSGTALGVTLILRMQQARPTVSVPLESETQLTEPASETTAAARPSEPTTETTGETIPEATGETVPETTAATVPETTAATTAPTTAPTKPQETVKATLIELHKRRTGDNEPFRVANMFPGDSVTQYYCVRVTHSDTVTLHYRADVRKGYEKLAEVLKCRVKVGDKILYDNLMRDMPTSLARKIPTQRRVATDVLYEITVYLDTSVGNAYQHLDLVADFRWWVEETGNLSSPKTGDTSGIYLWSALSALSLIALLALIVLIYRKDRRLAQLLAVLLLLALALSALFVSAFAAKYLGVEVRKNEFNTATVDIGLTPLKWQNLSPGIGSDGKQLIQFVEPGVRLQATFTLTNASTGDIYYKLYFNNVEGGLKDVLEVEVFDGDNSGAPLYSGKMSDLTRISAGPPENPMKPEEKEKHLILMIHFPEEAGNEYQNESLSFIICADAIQAKNNPDGEFYS